jgi:MYXO-CTERM domain-containing protein
MALGVSGGQQVGRAYFNYANADHACIWSGTAASCVDLHPFGADGQSQANAISSGHEVGVVQVGTQLHATMWSGSAASWVDLNPAGSTHSEALAISGDLQGGFAVVGGVTHASLWNGTAASWTDLHQFLPAGYTNSYVQGISSDGSNIFVVGYAELPDSHTHAILWSEPVPSPGPAGLIVLGALASAGRRRR